MSRATRTFPVRIRQMVSCGVLPVIASRDQPVAVNAARAAVRSIAGPPDAAFARELGANAVLRLAMSALSFTARRRAKRRHLTYSFLFMKADGDQLRELTPLIDAGKIRPVVDRVFPFEEIREAKEYVEQGRAKAGKVVVTMT